MSIDSPKISQPVEGGVDKPSSIGDVTRRLLDLREKAEKKEILSTEMITGYYEAVKQLLESGKEGESFQLLNSTMLLEASQVNAKTVENMGETAQHFRATGTVFGEDVDVLRKSINGFGDHNEALSQASHRMGNAAAEMTESANKMYAVASSIEESASRINR